MVRPPGITDEEWDSILEEKATQKLREAMIARVEREGFEMDGEDPETNETCRRREQKKRGNRWIHEPCGARAAIVMRMRSPDNPEGLRVPLCRACLATQIRHLITLMEFFG